MPQGGSTTAYGLLTPDLPCIDGYDLTIAVFVTFYRTDIKRPGFYLLAIYSGANYKRRRIKILSDISITYSYKSKKDSTTKQRTFIAKFAGLEYVKDVALQADNYETLPEDADTSSISNTKIISVNNDFLVQFIDY